MFFNFTFRHYLLTPQRLANDVRTYEMRGFWQRMIGLFVISFLLFSLRSVSGINTENLTTFFVQSSEDYALARYISLFGSMIWSIIYLAFHLFALSWVLSFLVDIPFRALLPMQFLMTAILLIEKAIVFAVFYLAQMSSNVSFLSFGPLAATLFEMPFFVFFFNQLTIATALIISYQYAFIRAYTDRTKKYRLLFLLIGLHLLMAIATASMTLIPFENIWADPSNGGVGHE